MEYDDKIMFLYAIGRAALKRKGGGFHYEGQQG